MQDLKAPLLASVEISPRPTVRLLLQAALVVLIMLGASTFALLYLDRQTTQTIDDLRHCQAELENDRIAKKLIIEAVQRRTSMLYANKVLSESITTNVSTSCDGKDGYCYVIKPTCLFQALLVLFAGTLLLSAFLLILGPLGFTAEVVVAGSAAAAWQATIGDVEAWSLYAILQHIAMSGAAGVLEVFTLGLAVDGTLAVGMASFCEFCGGVNTTASL